MCSSSFPWPLTAQPLSPPPQAHWQLLPDPLTLNAWWDLPHLSVAFFARGLQLLDPQDLSAAVSVPAPRCDRAALRNTLWTLAWPGLALPGSAQHSAGQHTHV